MEPRPLAAALQPRIDSGSVPGLVALVAEGEAGGIQEIVLGARAVDGPPMTRDSIFRIASMTKPITAAATMLLVESGEIDLDEPVVRWLPELAEPTVLASTTAELDDVVPAVRPITTRHLLTFTAGHGFPADFTAPVVARLMGELGQGAPTPHAFVEPDLWMKRLAGVPLLHQPGEGWTYNTGSDILGVLVARASGQPFDTFLQDRLFGPIGMPDTAFHVPDDGADRLVTWYLPGSEGLTPIDGPEGEWRRPPAFPGGAAGLVSTADDWVAFGRLLLAGGVTASGERVLSEASVHQMMSNHVEETVRASGQSFLLGRGWGFGGAVDLAADRPGRVAGRYGWIGGTGTSGHVIPARDGRPGEVLVCLTQVQLLGPSDEGILGDFWRAAATVPN